MASVRNEIKGVGEGFKAVGDAVSGLFDPAQRAARKTVREAERAAAEKVAKAQAKVVAAEAKVVAKTLEAGAEATVAAIEAGTHGTAAVAKVGVFSRIGKGISGIFTGSAKAGVRLVEQPVAVLLKPVKWVSQGVGKGFARSPVPATIITGAAVAVGIGSWLSRRKAANLQDEYQARAMQAMATQPQAAVPSQQPSYMNSASQAEVDARLAADRAKGVAPASKTEALAARTQMPAPENAAAL